MHKCQKCPQPATLHITEVLGEGQFEEVHLCEQCASKYLFDPSPAKKSAKSALQESGREDDALINQNECPMCGLKFVEFRNTSRLGCPHDYQAFREELMPLLESIHGETKHSGKSPRRPAQSTAAQAELMNLRNRLKQAVTKEDYEEAARIRDQIRHLEEV